MSTALVTETRVATVISGKELAGKTQFSTIQAAINYAATQTPSATQPWTIEIYPGVYDEAITCSAYVNLKGIGPKGSVVIYQLDATILTLADNVELQNFTVRLGTPSVNGRYLITDGAGAFTARMSDLLMEITANSAKDSQLFHLPGAGNYIIERCYGDIANAGGSFTLSMVSAVVRWIDNDFTLTSTVAYHIRCTGGTFTAYGSRWSGNSRTFWATGSGTSTLDHCALLATSGWVNTGWTITLRHCAIEAPVVAGNLAIVRLKDCSYKAISRSGTGNIVDESAELKDAPWKVHKWTWQAALLNAQVAVRGTPVDGGTGQVLLEVTDNAGGQEAVEQPADAAGALDSSFTPARTPRFATQISVDSFDADVTMFFGLRETLADTVPAATEHHAGFIWNGTAFNASSDDGTASETTDAGTPTTGVKHQLEVVVFGGVTTVGSVEFYVDGVLVATHSTKIPVNALDWQHLLQTAGLGGGDVIQVTVESGGCQECPA